MAVTKYVYDGDTVLQEYDGSGVTQTEYTSTGQGYGDLLSAYDGSAAKYYEPDALGSTDALADQSQAVIDRWRYRAFGTATQTVGTDSTPFTWVGRQGYYADTETGYYQIGNGTRDYDPATAQFLSDDPTGFAGGDLNLYRYVANNPTNRAVKSQTLATVHLPHLPSVPRIPPPQSGGFFGGGFGGSSRLPCPPISIPAPLSGEDCCKRFKQLYPEPEVRWKAAAFVICCYGRKVACLFQPNKIEDPWLKKVFDGCRLDHEYEHVLDPEMSCTPIPSIDFDENLFIRPVYFALPKDLEKFRRVERRGNAVEINCLMRRLKDCDQLPSDRRKRDCKDLIVSTVAYLIKFANMAYGLRTDDLDQELYKYYLKIKKDIGNKD